MGQNPDIALAAAAAILALIWALALVWHDLRRRGYAPYESLRRAAGELDGGDASAALRAFRRASRIAARDGDLAALAAAWRGIERARDASRWRWRPGAIIPTSPS